MEYTEIKTNEKMTQTLKDCLAMRNDAMSLYALKYIDELLTKVKELNLSNVRKNEVKLDDLFKALEKIEQGHYGSAKNFIERFINSFNFF